MDFSWLCSIDPFQWFFSCKGSSLKCCGASYKHVILPKDGEGHNVNKCCWVRRMGLWNSQLKEEIVTSNGLRVRLRKETLERLRQKQNDKAMKLVFTDPSKCIDLVCKFTCCPCVCCKGCCDCCCCCDEVKIYDLLIPGEAYIAGKDVDASCGPKMSSCSRLCCFPVWIFGHHLCENHVRIHHSEYELAEHEGDFIVPHTINIERSEVKGPASPRAKPVLQQVELNKVKALAVEVRDIESTKND